MFEVLVDGEVWREASRQILGRALSSLKNCETLSDLEEAYQRLEKAGARRYLFRCLARQSYSSGELSKKLQERNVSSVATLTTIQELEEEGYLDDKRVCESFVERCIAKGLAPYAIKRKLQERGIKSETIREVVSVYESQDFQKERIKALLEKKFKVSQSSNEKEKGRVIRSLLRKGYPLSLVFEVINRVS